MTVLKVTSLKKDPGDEQVLTERPHTRNPRNSQWEKRICGLFFGVVVVNSCALCLASINLSSTVLFCFCVVVFFSH